MYDNMYDVCCICIRMCIAKNMCENMSTTQLFIAFVVIARPCDRGLNLSWPFGRATARMQSTQTA